MNEELERHIPDRVWLQYFGEDDPEMLDRPPNMEMGRSDVSWCREKVFEHDIEYIRVTTKEKHSRAFEAMLAAIPDKEEFLATLSERLVAEQLVASIPVIVNEYMFTKKVVIKREDGALWVGFEPKDYEIIAMIVEKSRAIRKEDKSHG